MSPSSQNGGCVTHLHCHWESLQEECGQFKFTDLMGDPSCEVFNEGHSLGPNTPVVSIAIGAKKCEWDKFVYFSSFCASALAATSPGACAAKLWYKVKNLSQHVVSQTSGFPEDLGMIVTPSGCLPSSLDRHGVPNEREYLLKRGFCR